MLLHFTNCVVLDYHKTLNIKFGENVLSWVKTFFRQLYCVGLFPVFSFNYI